jgi:drug/metabolite transporter (DMT)-like permease
MGWPLLLLPMLVKRHEQPFISSNLTIKFFLICGGLGVLTAVDIRFYSWEVSFFPASTFSLLCATQLAFAVLFAFILVRHKITGYVMNAVVLLTLSAIMLRVHDHSRRPEGVTSGQFVLGFVFTIVGSALFGLCLPIDAACIQVCCG